MSLALAGCLGASPADPGRVAEIVRACDLRAAARPGLDAGEDALALGVPGSGIAIAAAKLGAGYICAHPERVEGDLESVLAAVDRR
jgi:hypothetical protein